MLAYCPSNSWWWSCGLKVGCGFDKRQGRREPLLPVFGPSVRRGIFNLLKENLPCFCYYRWFKVHFCLMGIQLSTLLQDLLLQAQTCCASLLFASFGSIIGSMMFEVSFFLFFFWLISCLEFFCLFFWVLAL